MPQRVRGRDERGVRRCRRGAAPSAPNGEVDPLRARGAGRLGGGDGLRRRAGGAGGPPRGRRARGLRVRRGRPHRAHDGLRRVLRRRARVGRPADPDLRRRRRARRHRDRARRVRPTRCAGRRSHAGLPAVLRGGGAHRSRGRHRPARDRGRPSDPGSRPRRIGAAGGCRRGAPVQPAQPDRARVHRGGAARARRARRSVRRARDRGRAPRAVGVRTGTARAVHDGVGRRRRAHGHRHLGVEGVQHPGSQVRADRHHESRRLDAVAGPAPAAGAGSGAARDRRVRGGVPGRPAVAGRSPHVSRRQPPSIGRAVGRARPRSRRRGPGGDVSRVARLLDPQYRRPRSVLPGAGTGGAQRRTAVRSRLRPVRTPELRHVVAHCSSGSWVRWATRCARCGREATGSRLGPGSSATSCASRARTAVATCRARPAGASRWDPRSRAGTGAVAADRRATASTSPTGSRCPRPC